MIFENNFPKRHQNHILETMSYKVFQNAIPNYWILREITERDYGFDGMLELTTNSDEVHGKFVAIQLKASKKLNFNNNGIYRHYGIEKRTTNYWLNSNLPTFIFFTDEETQKLFFISVKQYVRENYYEYKSKENFVYNITLSDSFTPERCLQEFKKSELLPDLENHINGINIFYNNFSDFFDNKQGRDFHMLIDDETRESELNQLYNEINYLCNLLGLTWNIPSIDTFLSKTILGDYIEMYEYHMTEILKEIDIKFLECLKTLQYIVLKSQQHYWFEKNKKIFDFFENLTYETFHQRYWRVLTERRGSL